MLFSYYCIAILATFLPFVIAHADRECKGREVAAVKASFKGDAREVCVWYLSEARNQTTSPVAQLSNSDFSEACQCIADRKQSHSHGRHSASANSTTICSVRKQTLLSKRVATLSAFCSWWNFSSSRSTSPFPSISARSLYEACACQSSQSTTVATTLTRTRARTSPTEPGSTPSPTASSAPDLKAAGQHHHASTSTHHPGHSKHIHTHSPTRRHRHRLRSTSSVVTVVTTITLSTVVTSSGSASMRTTTTVSTLSSTTTVAVPVGSPVTATSTSPSKHSTTQSQVTTTSA